MESKIWFSIPNQGPYDELLNVIQIDSSNYLEYLPKVNECVDLFKSHIIWDKLWDQDQAIERFNLQHKLFIYLVNNRVKAYVWLKENYIYNFFVAPEVIKDKISERFIKQVINLTRYDTYIAYTETWNKKVYNFVIKRLGGMEI